MRRQAPFPLTYRPHRSMTSARGNLDAGVVTIGWDDWAAPGMGQLNTCDSLGSSTAFWRLRSRSPQMGGGVPIRELDIIR